MEWLIENWQVALPLIGAVLVLFFPQLKPFVDALIRKPTPGPGPNPGPDGEQPKPNEDIVNVVIAIQELIDHFRKTRNFEGEMQARQAAKLLFDPPNETKT